MAPVQTTNGTGSLPLPTASGSVNLKETKKEKYIAMLNKVKTLEIFIYTYICSIN